MKTIATLIFVLLSRMLLAQDSSATVLQKNQFDLNQAGRDFLLREANAASFFLLGELHGTRDIAQLLYGLWPQMSAVGYQHIVAEVSPWAAQKLEFEYGADSLQVRGLWSNTEGRRLRLTGTKQENPTIWGCDMEEISLGALIADLSRRNKADAVLKKLADQTKDGYDRKKSPLLLKTIGNHQPARDRTLFENMLASLRIDSARAFPASRLKAQILREDLMKRNLLTHYSALRASANTKLLLRFGRNHLHRGFDSRGISTLGNFVSELAFAKGVKAFNVAAFASGGQFSLMGETYDADETKEDLAFQFLADAAKYPSTVFDLRPLRLTLHRLKVEERTALQKQLLYWADSYDAIICFKSPAPLRD